MTAPDSSLRWAVSLPHDHDAERGAPLESAGAFMDYVWTRARLGSALQELGARVWAVNASSYADMEPSECKAFDRARRRLLASGATAPTLNVLNLRDEVVDLLAREPSHLRGGVFITGLPGVGKTKAMTEVLADVAMDDLQTRFGDKWFEESPTALTRKWTNQHGDCVEAQYIPVVTIIMPSRPTARQLSLQVLHSIASLVGDPSLAEAVSRKTRATRASEASLTDAVVQRLRMHGVQFVVIDELHFVRGDTRGREVKDHLKNLMNRTTVIFVLAGVSATRGEAGFAMEGAASKTDRQLAHRFVTLEFEPFAPPPGLDRPYEDSDERSCEWSQLVPFVSARLRLLKQDPRFWSELDTLQYLWQRTGGVFTDLIELIEKAGRRAIGDSECLDIPDLETIRVSDAADRRAADQHQRGPLKKVKPGAGGTGSGATSKRGVALAKEMMQAAGGRRATHSVHAREVA